MPISTFASQRRSGGNPAAQRATAPAAVRPFRAQPRPTRTENRPSPLDSYLAQRQATPPLPRISADGGEAVRRRLGLELELPVPIDKLEPWDRIARRDQRILKGEIQDAPRLAELKERADAGYGKFAEIGMVELHADHSSRVGQYSKLNPPKTLGRSIIELVTKPAETEEELEQVILDCHEAVKVFDAGTNGLTKRSKFDDERCMGPINSEGGKPPGLGYDAAAQINVGVDVRQFTQFLDFYKSSVYRTHKSSKIDPIENAVTLARELTDILRGKRTEEELALLQNLNGIEGLLSMLALYLYAGNKTSVLTSTVKNFTPILSKTRFHSVKQAALTPKEIELWDGNIKSFARALLEKTRGQVDPQELLIKQTKRGGAPKSNYTVRDLLENAQQDLATLVVAKELAPEPVGPRRPTAKDKALFEGEDRRKGAVVEIRSLGGLYKPAQWLALGKTFLKKAQQINASKDYEE